MTLELALKRQGCLTCASRVRELGGLATCLFWSSGYFGSTRLPRTGCEHWRMRDSVDAQAFDVACEARETGPETKKASASAEALRVIDGVGSAGDRLTTVAYTEGSDG